MVDCKYWKWRDVVDQQWCRFHGIWQRRRSETGRRCTRRSDAPRMSHTHHPPSLSLLIKEREVFGSLESRNVTVFKCKQVWVCVSASKYECVQVQASVSESICVQLCYNYLTHRFFTRRSSTFFIFTSTFILNYMRRQLNSMFYLASIYMRQVQR